MGEWVGPIADLDGCGKPRSTGIRSPVCAARCVSLYWLKYSGPLNIIIIIVVVVIIIIIIIIFIINANNRHRKTLTHYVRRRFNSPYIYRIVSSPIHMFSSYLYVRPFCCYLSCIEIIANVDYTMVTVNFFRRCLTKWQFRVWNFVNPFLFFGTFCAPQDSDSEYLLLSMSTNCLVM